MEYSGVANAVVALRLKVMMEAPRLARIARARAERPGYPGYPYAVLRS